MWALRARYHDKRSAHALRDADLARSLTLDPQCSDALRVRTTALYDAGEQQEAWRLLRDARQRAPSHFGLMMSEAYLLINDRRLEDAIATIRAWPMCIRAGAAARRWTTWRWRHWATRH
ncbi:hypothetical protein G6F64_015057 [Rhizopus arrhizus]|uniref:Uncharacterized protein n=1 Tax=Rhizopus oryzae TaxID=64495 RepID=A0A9P6WSA1_RHIOR|nr:hypothetical protein G6F64_015057 [Rhizopus arrhizus]